MSTKIYNAYYTSLNLEDLLIRLKKLSPKFEDIKSDLYQKDLLNSTITQIDRKHLKGEEINQYNILFKEVINYQTQRRKWKNENIDFDNYSCTCIVFPLDKTKTLVLLYTSVSDMFEKFKSLKYMKNYEYYDNVEKPNNVSKKDWEQRLKDWDKVLGGDGYGVPLYNGYQFTLSSNDVNHFDFQKVKNLELQIPSNEDRADALIKHRFLNIKNLSDGNEWKKAIDKYNKFKKTDEYKKEMQVLINQLLKINFNEDKTSNSNS